MAKWKYDFDCRKCDRARPIDNTGTTYCLPGRIGIKTIHADDDRHVRCDYYTEMNANEQSRTAKESTGNRGESN